MQETCFSGTSLTLPKSPAKNSSSSQRSSRDLDDPLTENDHDRCSLASFGSGNTTDSDNKVSRKLQNLRHTQTHELKVLLDL